jgi:uncharacterized protein YccT (UPF0319 family)
LTRLFNISSLAALFICGSLSTISTHALAATVNVSKNLIVSEVNDKNIDHGFVNKKFSFELPQGNHALIVRYKDVFEDLDYGQDRVIESQDFVVQFAITDQKKLNLSTVKIKNLEGAESFAKSPELTLQDQRNNQIELTLAKVTDYKLAKQVDIAVNSRTTQQAIQSKKDALTQTSATTMNKNPNALIQVNSLTMLTYWWQNASKDERQRFKQLIIKN